MKVKLISGSHNIWGGGQIYLDNMSKELRRQGIDCEIYSSDDIFPDAIKINRIDTWFNKFKNLFIVIREIKKTSKPSDIVILNDITLSMCSLFFRFFGIKSISLVHMSLFNCNRGGWLFKFFYPRLRAKLINLGSDIIFSVNKENDIILARNKTVHVGNFINNNFNCNILKTDKTIDFLYVGRFDAEKQPEEFVHFVKMIHDKGESINAAMVGDGILHKEIEDLINSYGLANIIKLYGFVKHDDIWEIFKLTKNVVITSRTEGFPTVIIEAARCGANFISYPLGSIPYIHSKYSIGIIAKDIDSLVESSLNYIKGTDNQEVSMRLSNFVDDHTSCTFVKKIKPYLYQISSKN
ncbi:glycosyltransferase family 4 protein [Vibrio mimicus]